MAENKKSFILYSDIIHTVKKLPKDKIGDLFLTILQYVNDENPVVSDVLVDLVFEPIKHQLKRDLVEWEQTRGKRVKSGHEGGIKSGEVRRKQKEAKEASASTAKPNEANEAVNVNATVTDTVNATVTDKTNCVFESLKKYFGFEDELKHISKWSQISAFLNSFQNENKLSNFQKQFEFYKKYKEASKEKTHKFNSFISGGWDDANWEHEYKKLQSDKKDTTSYTNTGKNYYDGLPTK